VVLSSPGSESRLRDQTARPTLNGTRPPARLDRLASGGSHTPAHDDRLIPAVCGASLTAFNPRSIPSRGVARLSGGPDAIAARSMQSECVANLGATT
jgi:hypothetical protein